MSIGVYIDILIAVNFIIGYILIRIVSYLLPTYKSKFFLYLSAIIFSLGSLSIFLSEISNFQVQLLRLIASMIAIFVAFKFEYRTFLLRVMLLYSVAICFSVAVMAINEIFPKGRIFIYNGVTYFDVSPLVFIVALAVAYIATQLIIRLSCVSSTNSDDCRVEIVTDRGMITLKGLIDTGNKLTEPFSGYPVVVVKEERVDKVSPPLTDENDIPKEGVRIIPYYSVGGSGIMYAFKPTLLKVITNEGNITLRDVYIAVNKNEDNKDFDAIVSILCLKEGAFLNEQNSLQSTYMD